MKIIPPVAAFQSQWYPNFFTRVVNHVLICKNVKVKSLFWVHTRFRALLCRLWQVPSLVIGPLQSVYIHQDIHFNFLGSSQLLARNLAPLFAKLPSQMTIRSWVVRSNAAWNALLSGTTSWRTGRVLNPGLNLNPDPKSCTLALNHFTATICIF